MNNANQFQIIEKLKERNQIIDQPIINHPKSEWKNKRYIIDLRKHLLYN